MTAVDQTPAAAREAGQTGWSEAMVRAVLRISAWEWLSFALAGLLLTLSVTMDAPLTETGLIAAAGLLLLAAAGIGYTLRIRGVRVADVALSAALAHDPTPCVLTDVTGSITYRNAAARARLDETAALAVLLEGWFLNPAAVLYRLQMRAEDEGAAREDVVTRAGHLRLSVHRTAPGTYLWRLDEFRDRVAARGPETGALPMLAVNRDGVVLFSNDAARRLCGLRPRRLDQLFPGSPPRSGDEAVLTGLSGSLRVIYAEIAGAGDRREVYLLPLPEGAAPPPPTDVEHVPVALLSLRGDGTTLAANAAARALLGLAPDDLPGFGALFEGPGRPVIDWLGDVLAERLPATAEVLRARRGDGESFFQVTLQRVKDGNRPGLVAVLQDATALKRLETQIVQSQKMQAIGQLAGGIAHDFNNLLTAIAGHCDLLMLRHTALDSDYADLVQIHQNTNRAAALVGQLLAFSRKQVRRPERLNLPDLFSDLVHLLNRLVGERVTVQLTHDDALPPIRADRRQIEQVLMNLVVNARDAMDQSGTVRITMQRLHLASSMRQGGAVVPPGEYAVIRVADTGCGIPPDRLDKIFEPFFTTKKAGEGTGLGLSTVYGIVKQSGGFVFVESEPGQGTVFSLYFPAIAAEDSLPDPAPPVAPRPAGRRGQGNVLLVEDEAPVRAFASRALRMRGCSVLEAEDGEAALEMLRDPGVQVDVFVTDVVMPGLDGPTWVREALRQRPDTRVVFVSGYAEDALGQHGPPVPNSVFLPKPFSLNDLAAVVQAQME